MHKSECMIQCWKIPELKQFKIPAKSFRLLFRYFIICYSAVIFSLPAGQAGKFDIRYSKFCFDRYLRASLPEKTFHYDI